MIKLLDILNEMDYPKGKYIQVTDPSELKDIQDQLFDLVQIAYAPIGGNVKISSPSDILDPNLTYWKVADIDADPELDVVSFGKYTKHGIKHTGMGHDGDRANIKNLLTKKSQYLKTPGHYVEVSGPAFDSFVGKGGVPTVDDEETVRDILSPREINWHGVHPTDSSKKGNGWYTRTIGGGEHTKIMAGIPS
jgi:hypothetical protein